MHTHIKDQTAKIKLPFYYGWVIVLMAALGLFFSGPGQTYSISIFIDYYIEEFGWSRSLISSIYLAATLLAGSLMFLVGRLVDKLGQRYMTVVIASFLAVACLWNSLVIGPVMLFIGFFMLRFFGQGSMTLIPGTLVPQWFISKRGRAMSLMAIGGFVSSAALPPFNAWLIDTWGWPIAWRVWFAILLFFFVPLAYIFVRNKPEDIGLLPDNRNPKPPSSLEGIMNDNTDGVRQSSSNQPADNRKQLKEIPKQEVDEVSWTLKEARRTRAFWLILFCVMIPSLVNTGVVFHLISILGQSGISRTSSALVLSVMAIVSFPFTFMAGFVIEKVKVHIILAASFLGQCLVLLLLLFTDSIQMALLFGVVRGVVGGFEAISLGIIWPNYFGREHLGSIKGIALSIMVVGSAFGPLPFALSYDWFGGYHEIIIGMMLLPLLGILAALSSPAPEKTR
jgi:MFS family permease